MRVHVYEHVEAKCWCVSSLFYLLLIYWSRVFYLNPRLTHSATLVSQLTMRNLHLSLMRRDCNHPSTHTHLAFISGKQVHYLLSHSTVPCHVILNFSLELLKSPFLPGILYKAVVLYIKIFASEYLYNLVSLYTMYMLIAVNIGHCTVM